jgi:hypothetical protein
LLKEEKVKIIGCLKEEKKMEEITADYYVHPYPVW